MDDYSELDNRNHHHKNVKRSNKRRRNVKPDHRHARQNSQSSHSQNRVLYKSKGYTKKKDKRILKSKNSRDSSRVSSNSHAMGQAWNLDKSYVPIAPKKRLVLFNNDLAQQVRQAVGDKVVDTALKLNSHRNKGTVKHEYKGILTNKPTTKRKSLNFQICWLFLL